MPNKNLNLVRFTDRFCEKIEKLVQSMRSINVNMHPIKAGTIAIWVAELEEIRMQLRSAIPKNAVAVLRMKRFEPGQTDSAEEEADNGD